MLKIPTYLNLHLFGRSSLPQKDIFRNLSESTQICTSIAQIRPIVLQISENNYIFLWQPNMFSSPVDSTVCHCYYDLTPLRILENFGKLFIKLIIFQICNFLKFECLRKRQSSCTMTRRGKHTFLVVYKVCHVLWRLFHFHSSHVKGDF